MEAITRSLSPLGYRRNQANHRHGKIQLLPQQHLSKETKQGAECCRSSPDALNSWKVPGQLNATAALAHPLPFTSPPVEDLGVFWRTILGILQAWTSGRHAGAMCTLEPTCIPDSLSVLLIQLLHPLLIFLQGT